MPQDRQDRKSDDSLYRSHNRVGLFVDYENIRRSIEHTFSPSPPSSKVCDKLHEMASRFGRVLFANAYADWSISEADPREFRRRQIEPKLVLTKEDGEDRTSVAMSLDAAETLFGEPNLDVYVIASGNSDFQDLIQRLRRKGKLVVICGPREETGRELIRGADKFLPLDELLGVRASRAPGPVTWDDYDWTGFIELIRDLDEKLNFVGLRYVATKVLNPHNCGLSDRGQKQELLNRAIDLKIIDPYQVENIEEGGEPVSACRLNHDHPLVRTVLAEVAEPEAPGAEPDAPVDELGEAPAEPPAVAPRRSGPSTLHSSVSGDEFGRPGEVQ